ncbi:pectate lyase [Massilia atriviolacea]|uniref:Pectate lyase n=1 Tax=Massilia atriviolacea TaxID=2495579 RepID=A0A430HMA5_9BURK|nr:pectate lyase [Massilia atriviolacea]
MTPPVTPPAGTDPLTQAAPATGWASYSSGTRGGAAATQKETYLVSSPSQLLAALKAQAGKPAQIKVYGTIDMAASDNGGAFKSASDQAARSLISIPSNTTVIGVGSDARIVNGRIMIKGVDNVIVRNLTIANPCDIAPKWDPKDGSSGNWNSEYDGLNVDKSTHVWIDHNTFTDAPRTDDQFPQENGKLKQCHDGALDVKNGSDYVTVSNNVFELHEKNTLVGSSDSTTADDGHLTVTFHGNHYKQVTSRAPRVRFGKVHVYNNYYEGDRNAKLYAHHYSIGVGYKAKIVSQNNAFDIIGATECGDAIEASGSSSKTGAIVDSGSLLNGAALGLGGASCKFSNAVGWTLPYTPALLDASKVRESVLRNAGAGKLSVR